MCTIVEANARTGLGWLHVEPTGAELSGMYCSSQCSATAPPVLSLDLSGPVRGRHPSDTNALAVDRAQESCGWSVRVTFIRARRPAPLSPGAFLPHTHQVRNSTQRTEPFLIHVAG